MLTVEFTVMGIPCPGLNGGPALKHNQAFSFQVATIDLAETDRYWNAIVGNGEESECGWCQDKWGLSWHERGHGKDRRRGNRGGCSRLTAVKGFAGCWAGAPGWNRTNDPQLRRPTRSQ